MTQVSKLPYAEDDSYVHASPEQRLMMAIITTAVADILGTGPVSHPSERERYRREALNWFENDSRDFRYVCQVAGLEPEHVRKSVLEFVASGKPMPRTTRVLHHNPNRRRSNVNATEVAQIAGVSVTTVRKVLTGDEHISAEYRNRVVIALAEYREAQETQEAA